MIITPGESDEMIAKIKLEYKQEIAANYEKYIRARDPFPWRSIHQNLILWAIRFALIQI